MNAYRKPAEMPLAIVEPVKVAPRGLVRANGATCLCTPPGRLWRWWYAVQHNDVWFCIHGDGWKWTPFHQSGDYSWQMRARWDLQRQSKADP